MTFRHIYLRQTALADFLQSEVLPEIGVSVWLEVEAELWAQIREQSYSQIENLAWGGLRMERNL